MLKGRPPRADETDEEDDVDKEDEEADTVVTGGDGCIDGPLPLLPDTLGANGLPPATDDEAWKLPKPKEPGW